eukprot:gnl/TRDRNA2_/TRDRNA2_147162_c0_seq1.p1 gnl/TRDRNA2_/TRDRNA2_147162_c0~~gnl/TRDRNA2_/TRDRNA2_147162_c0_seq1.p1  ORF type:complete len:476 (+),score=74.47 gnl/TRDRNA2_/TRDRNA2_147162_c0_seq1:72-1499(+)
MTLMTMKSGSIYFTTAMKRITLQGTKRPTEPAEEHTPASKVHRVGAPAASCGSVFPGAVDKGKSLTGAGLPVLAARRRRTSAERIAELLRRLGREARQQVIAERMQQWQRLELERFMLTQQDSSLVPPAATSATPLAKRHAMLSNALQTKVAAVPTATKYTTPACKSPFKRMARTRKVPSARPQARASCQDRIRGIFRRRCANGTVKYRASLSLAGLRLQTAARGNVDEARQDYLQLLAIRRRMQQEAGPIEVRLRHALADVVRPPDPPSAEVLDCTESSSRSLGLIFRVAACALYGRVLLSPTYSTAELDKALAAWRQLRKARLMADSPSSGASASCTARGRRRRTPAAMSRSWPEIQRTYMQLWSAAGADPVRVRRTLERTEQLAATRLEREWEQWNRVRMSAEDRRSRRERQRLLAEELAARRAARCQARQSAREADIVGKLEALIESWSRTSRQTARSKAVPAAPLSALTS